ncbi:hypothetical protein CJ030_MR4G025321 [Morella rubra]|uniref:Uncharacterized protein n=1 Tax=Morella rubra TaxID=262757 RepID=A0A6A1VR24_9ROSI|nr:hypothetical protein CJ030_MR4G025321 [Morella rubra]
MTSQAHNAETEAPLGTIRPEVQKEIDELDEFNKKQEKRIHNIEAKALQLTNLYFVFQGVILSSISSASSVKCRHFWIPTLLSLLASALNVVALIGTLNQFLNYSEALDQIREDRNAMAEHRVLTRAQLTDRYRRRPDRLKTFTRKVYVWGRMTLYASFSVVMLYGCHTLLLIGLSYIRWSTISGCNSSNDRVYALQGWMAVLYQQS